MDKPRSEAQIAASRANGALSRGPVTEEGKAISSRNAMSQGTIVNGVTGINSIWQRAGK